MPHTPDQKVESAFLAVLDRFSTQDERARAVAVVHTSPADAAGWKKLIWEEVEALAPHRPGPRRKSRLAPAGGASAAGEEMGASGAGRAGIGPM